MAWGARQHDDGSWRLCERKGRTLLHLCCADAQDVQIVWKTRSGAEKCAKELNELWWPFYAKTKRLTDGDVQRGIIATIHKHGGLTDADMQRIYP